MKWLYYLCLLAPFFLPACDTPSANNHPFSSDTTETDTTNYALNDDSVKLTLANPKPPEGFYQVMLPCTNCKGIEHTVLFNPDLSFRLEEKVMGSNEVTTKTKGVWKPVHEDVWLYKDSSVVARYTWHGDTLNYIDSKSGVQIPLRPLQNVLDNATWKSKKTQGVAVFGIGNEPFWNITINEQKSIVFTLADWPKPITFKRATSTVSADSTVYATSNDSARLRVVVYNTFCSDGMSDNVYSSHINVQYNDKMYQGCGVVYK